MRYSGLTLGLTIGAKNTDNFGYKRISNDHNGKNGCMGVRISEQT